MAKAPPGRQRANLTDAQKRAAIPRLLARVQQLKVLPTEDTSATTDARLTELQTRIEQTVSSIFGPETHEYIRLRAAWSLIPLESGRLSLVGSYNYPGGRADSFQRELREKCDRAVGMLSAAVQNLEEELGDQAPDQAPSEPAANVRLSESDVFVVHGQDEQAKIELCLVLTRAGLNPIVLHEQPNEGRTIIEKFEDHAGSVGFAIVLLTPDDDGGPVGGAMKPRARQNVIGEMFWFAAKLGRNRVCALRKGDVEIPSDFAGIVYTDMDARGAWRSELLKELAAAGYAVDWAKALA